MKFHFSPKMSRTLGKTSLAVRKHAPTVAVVGGVACMIGGTIWACAKMPEVKNVVDDAKDELQALRDLHEGLVEVNSEPTDPISDKEYRLGLLKIAGSTGLKVLNICKFPLILETVGTVAVLGGHFNLRNNYISLGSTLAAAKGSYDAIVKRIDEHCSKDEAEYLKYGVEKKELTTVNEKGKEKKETVAVIGESGGPESYSPYAKFFMEGNPNWTKSPEANMFFLTANQTWANDRLQRKGHLFLNEVYDQLGIERTAAGQHVGWIIKKDEEVGDNYVDFGIHNYRMANKRFVNGYEPVILLDFNVTEIVDLI